MQCRPLSAKRRVDHGLDIGGAGKRSPFPVCLVRRTMTPLYSSNRDVDV